jgi:hypothetical protein
VLPYTRICICFLDFDYVLHIVSISVLYSEINHYIIGTFIRILLRGVEVLDEMAKITINNQSRNTIGNINQRMDVHGPLIIPEVGSGAMEE